MNNLPATQTDPIAPPAWSERSGSIAKLAAALSKAQAKIEAVKKDSNNPFFKSKYADLSSVWAAIREPLTDNELSILQEPGVINGRLSLTTTLLHSSGEYVRSSFEIPVTKQDAQGFGSAITYARRYALQAVMGIAPEDDDGNAASQGAQAKQSAKQPQSLPPTVKPADKVAPPQEHYYDLTNYPIEKIATVIKRLQTIGAKQVDETSWITAKRIEHLDAYEIDPNTGAILNPEVQGA